MIPGKDWKHLLSAISVFAFGDQLLLAPSLRFDVNSIPFGRMR